MDIGYRFNKSKALTVTLKTKNTHNLDLPLSLNNTAVDTVSSHKHLGMEITSNLSWKDHILTVSENANKKLNILAKLKMLVDRKSLITMDTSFIRSGMEHGSIVYCNCSDTDHETLESVQRRAFKTRGTQRAHTSLAEADHYSHIAHCKNVEPWL